VDLEILKQAEIVLALVRFLQLAAERAVGRLIHQQAALAVVDVATAPFLELLEHPGREILAATARRTKKIIVLAAAAAAVEHQVATPAAMAAMVATACNHPYLAPLHIMLAVAAAAHIMMVEECPEPEALEAVDMLLLTEGLGPLIRAAVVPAHTKIIFLDIRATADLEL